MEYAEQADIDGLCVRVVRADYLAAMALQVGRAKDRLRILALLENGAVTTEEVAKLANQYKLTEKWGRFQEQFLNES